MKPELQFRYDTFHDLLAERVPELRPLIEQAREKPNPMGMMFDIARSLLRPAAPGGEPQRSAGERLLRFVEDILAAGGDPWVQEVVSEPVVGWLVWDTEARQALAEAIGPRLAAEIDAYGEAETRREVVPFLHRVVAEIPELRAVLEDEMRLDGGEVFTTAIIDHLSTNVMERQGRILSGKASERDRAVVERWLLLGEAAMEDAVVADVFLQTAGDDLLWDERGQSLLNRLGPKLRTELYRRYPEMAPPRP